MAFPRRESPPGRLWASPLWLGLFSFGIYLAVAWFILPPAVFWSPDEGAKFLQLQNLRLEHGQFAYDVAYPGRDVDPDLRFATGGMLHVAAGRLYFQRFPLFPLLALPWFLAFSFYGLYLIPAAGGAAIGAFSLYLLEPRDRRRAPWLAIAFGSPVFIYSVVFWEHTLATALCLGAAALSLRADPVVPAGPFRRNAKWIGVGLAMGLGAYIRMETAIFAAAWLCAYGIIRRKENHGAIWAGATLGILLLAYEPLHRVLFGQTEQALPNSAICGFHGLSYLKAAGWQVVRDLLVGASGDGALDPGRAGWGWAGAALAAVAAGWFAATSPAARRLKWACLAATAGIGATFLFSRQRYWSAHGLLFTAPWAILGLTQARAAWRSGSWRQRVAVWAMAGGLLGYAAMLVGVRAPRFGPHGAYEWGARYAMTFYPLLAVAAVQGLKTVRRNAIQWIIVGALVALGIGFQIRGIRSIRHDKQINAALLRIAADSPGSAVVSDRWFMPFTLAPLAPSKPVFVAEPERWPEWMDAAEAHGVSRFILVTSNAAWLEDAAPMLAVRRLVPLGIWQNADLSIFHLGRLPETGGRDAP